MKLFRIFPFNASAAHTDEGGALYISPPSSLGRIANVDLYRELYFTAQPEAAVAEVFGFLPAWYSSDFAHANGMPFALSSYEFDSADRIIDLNNTAALKRAGIRQPSNVVTRDRRVTQAWARAIFSSADFCGVSWWSYYCPDWSAYGLWDLRSLRHVGPPEILTPAHPAVTIAANTIVRQVHMGTASPARRRSTSGQR